MSMDKFQERHFNSSRASRLESARTAISRIRDSLGLIERDLADGKFGGSEARRVVTLAVTLYSDMEILQWLKDTRAVMETSDEPDESVDSPERELVRCLAAMSADSTNPTSAIVGMVEAARVLVPDWSQES